MGLLVAHSSPSLYPFAKRHTYLPQVLLGGAFSWGIVLAFIEVQGERSHRLAGSLFVGSVLWIVAYDTFYAMVDRADDIQIGVKVDGRAVFGDGAVSMIAVYCRYRRCLRGTW